MVSQVVKVQDITISETEVQAFRRLLQKARTEGVRLGQDHAGRYWAQSTSTPDTWYALTAYSCTCKGFAGHQRCKHLAALLSALGWLPEAEQGATEAEVIEADYHTPCRTCGGMGEVSYQRRTGPRAYVTDWQTCHCMANQTAAA